MATAMIELDAWLGFYEKNKGYTAATIYNYRKAVLAFGEWLTTTHGVDVCKATAEHLQRFAGEVLHSRGQAPNSRRIAVSALRGYYDWLFSRRLVPTDTAASLPFPRKIRTVPVPIPADDVSKILAEVDLQTFKGIRDLAMLSVLLCGPRVSGVSGLNQGDLIFTMNEVGLEELTLCFREKGRNERYVPAPEETRLAARAYLGHPELELIDRRLENGDQVLFVNTVNSRVPAIERRGEARRLSPWAIRQIIIGYGEAAGVNARFLHPHAWRHLYGQELAEHDTPLPTFQTLMGHGDAKSSLIYSHIAVRKIREQAMKASPMRRIRHPASALAAQLKASVRR